MKVFNFSSPRYLKTTFEQFDVDGLRDALTYSMFSLLYFIVSCMSQNIMHELFFYSKITCLVKMVNYLR